MRRVPIVPVHAGASSAVAVRGPAALEWRDVTLSLGQFAVRDLSLRVEPEAWIAVVGPTGAGKTLLLEIAAGFLRPAFGCVLRAGRDVTAEPPERRDIGYVPQDDLLFPQLDVRGNLRFAMDGPGTAEGDRRFARIVSGLGLAGLLDRAPGAVSGGEAQRVALGRALLAGTDVLLLDECTSALDAETRETVGWLVERERRDRGLAVVQVTHDLEEARRLADAIVAMNDGRLAGVVPRRERSAYAEPATGGAR